MAQNVLVIGGSKNIGYFAAVRLLEKGATVTFLLRSPSVFDRDAIIQKYVAQERVRLVQGDALKQDDVQRSWTEAADAGHGPVNSLIFTVGGTPSFSLFRGFLISPENLVTQCYLNVLATVPTPHPKIISVSSRGLTRAGHLKLPFLLRPLYAYLAVPHKDKCGAEEIAAYAAGLSWDSVNSAGSEILPEGWKKRIPVDQGGLKSIAVMRPALLTDGKCQADQVGATRGKRAYRVKEEETDGGWTISRKDVAHFIVEGILEHWDEWQGKRVCIAY